MDYLLNCAEWDQFSRMLFLISAHQIETPLTHWGASPLSGVVVGDYLIFVDWDAKPVCGLGLTNRTIAPVGPQLDYQDPAAVFAHATLFTTTSLT